MKISIVLIVIKSLLTTYKNKTSSVNLKTIILLIMNKKEQKEIITYLLVKLENN